MDRPKADLLPRVENTRAKKNVVKFDIDEIGEHFTSAISEIGSFFDVADSFIKENRCDEANYIFRTQVVMLESAFDFYLHELLKYGLNQIFTENWPQTEKYKNILMRMETVDAALKCNDDEWFLEFVNDNYAKSTLTSYDAVHELIRLLDLDFSDIANRTFYERGSSEKPQDKFKRRINELYNRRNAIAHQYDREHRDASANAISEPEVRAFLNDTVAIVNAINTVVSEKDNSISV